MSTTELGASEPDAGSAPRSGARFPALAKTVVPVVVALVAGGGVVFALEHRSGSGSAAAGGSPLAVNGGGVAGEQHLVGTVDAVSATTITVRTGRGSTTFVVNATTEVVRDGQQATLAQVQVGDPVLVHVYPSSSGTLLVERILAGSSANGIGPPGQGFGPGAAPRGATT